MTKKQKAYKNALLRRLHTSPRYTEYFAKEPIAYRAFLKKHLGVDSSKELSIAVLKELVAYFELKSETIPSNFATPQQIAFIRHAWQHTSRNKDEASLLRFAKRILKKELSSIEEIRSGEAKRLIAALRHMKPSAACTPTRVPTLPTSTANNPHYRKGEA